jgi:thioredoxin-related protein
MDIVKLIGIVFRLYLNFQMKKYKIFIIIIFVFLLCAQIVQAEEKNEVMDNQKDAARSDRFYRTI